MRSRKLQHRVAPVGQLAAVRHVAARAVVHRLAPDVALRHGDVPNQIAERERAGLVGPLDPVGGDAGSDAARALAHALEVMQEFIEVEHRVSLPDRSS
jgi:hypothetical protein